jgi:hypothetical protein
MKKLVIIGGAILAALVVAILAGTGILPSKPAIERPTNQPGTGQQ